VWQGRSKRKFGANRWGSQFRCGPVGLPTEAAKAAKAGAGDGNRTHDTQLGKHPRFQRSQKPSNKTAPLAPQLHQRLAGRMQNRRPLIAPHRTVSVPRWAEIAGLADDGRSVATARKLIDTGQGPMTVKVGQRHGVRLQDHARWARSQPWAKYLAACAAAEREKREGRTSSKRRSK